MDNNMDASGARKSLSPFTDTKEKKSGLNNLFDMSKTKSTNASEPTDKYLI